MRDTPSFTPAHGSPSGGRVVAEHVLERLAAGGPIAEAVAVVVAHPDDEMIGAAAAMTRFLDLILIHVTDGAPLEEEIWRARDFASREDYAAARRRELAAALAAACVRPVRQLCYRIVDGTAADHVRTIAERLAADFMSVEAVLTHPYEGGHVDHDACARAVHEAARMLRLITGRAPGLLEFTSYYHCNGAVRAGVFWPDPGCRDIALPLSASDQARRWAALACFESQAGNLRLFAMQPERFRLAPDYDFSREPPPRHSANY